MLILAIDTTGSSGSIALLSKERIVELVPLAGRLYSAQLMPAISALLARHSLDKRAIDAFAVATGPGSFTGLRVGLSTVKALAEITRKPVLAVSLLEAMAWAGVAGASLASHPGREPAGSRGDSPAIAVLDAMRGEVYVGEYVVRQHSLPQLLREILMSLPEFTAEAQTPVFASEESIVAALRERGVRVQAVARPQSDVIARLGAMKLAAGHVTSPEALDANYMRRSDAEIFSKRSS